MLQDRITKDMSSSSASRYLAKIYVFWLILTSCNNSINAQLTPTFYAKTCPNLQNIVRGTMSKAVAKEPRMGASILRLFFHDCFVNVSIVWILILYVIRIYILT